MDKTILIGDAGGTKTDWRLIRSSEISQFKTSGFNAFTHSLEDFVKDIVSTLPLHEIDECYLYCAGAHAQQQKSEIANHLQKILSIRPVVESDLLGAARAACGKHRGYVGIIGTGSNASHYNGVEVEKVSVSLGYILGDEGSGAYLGKQLLKMVYRNRLDGDVIKKFQEKFNLPTDLAISQLYHAERPNQYLSSFVPFISENRHHPDIYPMIYQSLSDFFDAFFWGIETTEPIHFVGSVSFVFGDILRQVATDHQFRVGKMLDSPIAGLVVYHTGDE